MDYLYIKALHVIGVVCWFAGLFYIVRLFIYHTEAKDKESPENYAILNRYFCTMERRLWYGITVPSMLLTTVFGVMLVVEIDAFANEWFWLKCVFLVGLFMYHFSCGLMRKKIAEQKFNKTSKQLRIKNEIATVYLIALVFLAIVKDVLAPLWGLIGFALLAGLIVAVMKFKKK